MGDQLDIFATTRKHDLPPRWDGRPVEWSDWRDSGDIFICPPPPPRENRCEHCGSERPRLTAIGRVWTEPGEVLAIRRARLNSGRHLVANITALRCPDCLRDYVIDGLDPDSQEWFLDPSDYEDEGSWER